VKPGLYRVTFPTHSVVARVRILCGSLVVIMPSGWHHDIRTLDAQWERIGE
jgi:hypothetical protein